MALQKGSTVNILIGEETTFDTVATVGFVVPVNSFGVRANRAKNTAVTLTGTRNPAAPFDGNLALAGPVVVPIDSLAMPYWLQKMFGDAVTTGADPFVHEYKIGSSMPSFSLEAQYTDLAVNKYDQFTGCKVAAFSIDVGGDGELVGNIEVVGASETMAGSAFDAAPTTITLARLANFEAAITEGGGALAIATGLSLNINFGLDLDKYVIGGGGVLGRIPEGIVSVSGNLKTLFEDTTLLTKALNSTESAIKLTVTGSASSIFELEIQELEYERNSPDIQGPTGLLVDLNFQGFYADGAEASAIVARVTNAVASY